MIVGKDFLNKLKVFGLNSYEAKLWVALLSKGIATAGELSDIANVPRSRTYDVLESLEKKGFIITKLGRPIKFIAMQPAEALERLKKKIKEDVETQTKIIEEAKTSGSIDELNKIYTQNIQDINPNEISGIINERGRVYDQLEAMIKRAKKELLIMTTKEGYERKTEILKNTLGKNQIKIRIISPAKPKQTEGIEHKQTEQPARFCIVDKKEVLLMPLEDTTHPSNDFAIWLNAPQLAEQFVKIFEHNWKN